METPMQPLSPAQILAVWETGRPQHALDRALTILAAATPGASRAALADLPIGERDARLLQLRRLVFGAEAEGFAECPNCVERVEFPLDLAALAPPGALEGRASARPANAPAEYTTETSGITLRFRVPTSRDLAQVLSDPNSSVALRTLVTRCVFSPNESLSRSHAEPRRRRGTSQLPTLESATADSDLPPPNAKSFAALCQPQDHNPGELPAETVEALSRAMIEAAPEAEIILRLTCPACGHEWDLLFDIAEFFWREISAQAQRLLREIDTLARAYGWTEAEILSLPAQRRQTYLEMLAA
jgi:hypothetical protein